MMAFETIIYEPSPAAGRSHPQHQLGMSIGANDLRIEGARNLYADQICPLLGDNLPLLVTRVYAYS